MNGRCQEARDLLMYHVAKVPNAPEARRHNMCEEGKPEGRPSFILKGVKSA